jgi:hypothetical protein
MRLLRLLITVLLLAGLILVLMPGSGCSEETAGPQGPIGPQEPVGPQGPVGPQEPVGPQG